MSGAIFGAYLGQKVFVAYLKHCCISNEPLYLGGAVAGKGERWILEGRIFFFFLRKVFEVRETGNPEVPLYFGEGLRRSLGNAAGCAGGGQMGCAGLSFAWMFLCVETQLGAIS